MGATPQRQAKGRSERSRPALSPAVTGSCPAVSTPTPGRATSCGATALTRGVRWASRSLISACRACQRRARSNAFLVADAGSLIGPGRRSAQEQTRWRIHLAQRARTGSGADDDRVDLGTALGQAASARSSPTCFWPSTWSCSTTQSSMQAQGCPLSSAACMCHWWRLGVGAATRAAEPRVPGNAPGRGRGHHAGVRNCQRQWHRTPSGRGLAYGLAANIAYVGYLLTLRHAAGDTRHVAGQLFDATETICRWADIKLRVLQRRSLWPWPPRRKRPEPTGNIGPNARSSGRPRQACRPIRAADAPPTRCPLTSANVG